MRLAEPPTAELTVSVQRSSGDVDLSIVSGTQLTFTPMEAPLGAAGW